MRRKLSILLVALQAWMPVSTEWQLASAAADDIVKHATEGQAIGTEVLRGGFGTVRNTTLTTSISTLQLTCLSTFKAPI